MADKIINEDINFQPETQGFSFSTVPESKKKYKKKLSIFFALFLGLPIFLIIFCLIFVFLNFINLINLSSISSSLKFLPKQEKVIITNPRRISNTNQYSVDGVLYGFDEANVKIKYLNKYLIFQYDLESKFYISETIINNQDATNPIETIGILKLASSILTKDNIGKNITIQYKIESGKYKLETLTLYK